jgi:broad specificity phosphatase PhoE
MGTKNIIFVVRHFETSKNTAGIHGLCEMKELTPLGHHQAKRIATVLRKYPDLKGITYFDRPQAKESALMLSQLSSLPIEKPLDLRAADMGIASGLTHKEFRKRDVRSAESLEAFRTRDIDATQVVVSNSESPLSIEKRLIEWWETEGKTRCVNRVIIGSNSTLLMLTNLLSGKLPLSGQYKCFGIPNGAFRLWWQDDKKGWITEPSLEQSRWPELECRRIHTKKGSIQSTYYYAGWEIKNRACIIASGYFGNSRLGPYGLYVRLARELALHGVECLTFDYLGSGESSPVTRTFETDVFSLTTVISRIESTKSISIIGHSIGSSVVAEVCRRNNKFSGFALAPIHILDEPFFSRDQFDILLHEGFVHRKGIEIELQYLRSAEEAWLKGHDCINGVVVADADPYTSNVNIPYPESNVVHIQGADHNFSNGRSSNELIQIVEKLILQPEFCTEI